MVNVIHFCAYITFTLQFEKLVVIDKELFNMPNLQAWMDVIGLQFAAVRDGFYAELRRQRKNTPPSTVFGLDDSPHRSRIVGFWAYAS
jgi:hypothetical protein